MTKKKKILIILLVLVVIGCGSAITYSLFTSSSNGVVQDQELAQFVFETKKTDHIDLALVDLLPGDSENYIFQISNKDSKFISHVTLNYQITIKTMHLMPLDIKLYKINDSSEDLVLTCDETFSRDEENNLVCTSPIVEMEYSKESLDNYKIVVDFNKEYNSAEYADLVDYITVGIKSWQKTK